LVEQVDVFSIRIETNTNGEELMTYEMILTKHWRWAHNKRPKAMNAFEQSTHAELMDGAGSLDKDDDVRGWIITGNEKASRRAGHQRDADQSIQR